MATSTFVLRCLGVALAMASTGGCGSSGASSAPRGAAGSANAGPSGTVVQQYVVEERMPDGSIRRTTVTKRQVEAPPPPPRPADPFPTNDPIVRYNVERVNAYRAQNGRAPLLYDASISAFARQGSERLAKDHVPHANFAAHAQGAPGFGSRSAENQGDPSGVPAMDADPARSSQKQVDIMLKLMMDEGPGGGHYENMLNTRFRRIGIGIVYVGGRMYMTNDFSD